MPKFGTEQEEVMREKTMKKGHLLLTLLAFVCLMGLGTIHANAETVKAKVDVKNSMGWRSRFFRRLIGREEITVYQI